MNTQRKRSMIVTAVLAVLLVVAGTFAWTSFSQRALNENNGTNTPPEETDGGRVHDDYNKGNGNKDIYGENYGTEDLVVRIKLSEYFETNGTPLVSGTSKADRDTWTPYVLPSTAPSSSYRDYVNWTLGGSKNYLPTFNTNNSNLATDASGDAIDFTTNGQTAVGDGTHDYFTNGQQVQNPDDASQTHTVKPTETQNQAPMSMADWISKGRPTGNFWVIDTDGWAYWATTLKPGTATSLLLDQLTYSQTNMDKINGDWYYGIDVIGEFASLEDADKFPNSDHGAPSSNGNDLLDVITGKKKTTYALAITNPANGTTVNAGESVQATAKVTATDVNNQTSDVTSDARVTWTVSPTSAASVDSNGNVTMKDVSSDTAVTLTATSSKYNVSNSIQLTAKKVVTYTYALDFTTDVSNVSMDAGANQQFGAKVSKKGSDGTTTDATDANISWSVSPTNIASVDNTGKVTLQSGVFDNSTVTVTAKDATHNVTNSFTLTAKGIQVGDTFDFHGEDYIYLKDQGDNNRLILRKYLLETGAATSITYNGSNLDKAMQTYYAGLSSDAKAEVQPVQTSFAVGSPKDGTAVGRDSNLFLVTSPTSDRAVVTEGGTKKAFALSLDELNDVSGTGKAFPTATSRGATRASAPATTTNWWLRSPFSTATAWGVYYDVSHVGQVSYLAMSNAWGGRPAVIIHR